jgi:ketosteroid isomerase-like protein
MRLAITASVLALACSTLAQVAAKPAAGDDADLKSVEQKWVNAYYGGDDKTLSLIEADDFKAIANNEKPQTKAEQIAGVQGRGPVGVPSPNVEEEIRHYGEVAVITGLNESSNVRFTTVWYKTNGQWKIVHLHYSTGN